MAVRIIPKKPRRGLISITPDKKINDFINTTTNMNKKQHYSAPEIEVINARIEKGFEGSGLGLDPDFTGNGESQETWNTSNQYQFS